MSDTLTRPATSWPIHAERRRPGRIADPSPALIPLMRKPTDEAVRAVLLYDAPNFVLPDPAAVRFNPQHFLRVLTAAGACGLVWAAAFKGMMVLWG